MLQRAVVVAGWPLLLARAKARAEEQAAQLEPIVKAERELAVTIRPRLPAVAPLESRRLLNRRHRELDRQLKLAPRRSW